MKRFFFSAILFAALLLFGVTSFAQAPAFDSSISDGTTFSAYQLDSGEFENFVLDSGNPNAPPPNMGDDVHAIRQYIEFGLFGLLPVAAALLVIIAAIKWFSDTFTAI